MQIVTLALDPTTGQVHFSDSNNLSPAAWQQIFEKLAIDMKETAERAAQEAAQKKPGLIERVFRGKKKG